jgi:uncharacterized protein YndB with AHSA1/START domain
MKPFNWGRFVTRININAPIEKIYQSWATRAGIEAWFLRLSEYRKADGSLRENDEPVETTDTYRWRWHGWPDDTTETGTILKCNGTDCFSFSFGNAGNCTVTIKKEQGETIVELLQEDIPDTEEGRHQWHLGCKTGWTFYLANLKSLLEGGIDLRNKNEKLNQVINS